MSEDSLVGAGVSKSINCLEKEVEGELVHSAAAALLFCRGFSAAALQVCWRRK